MRTIFLSLIGLITLVACNSSDQDKNAVQGIPVIHPNDSTQFTTIIWLDSLKDFGTVKDGEKVEVLFRYKNTGEKALVVHSVVASCGCTVPEYTKEPIAAGKEGFIKAVFNSSGQHATVHKTITVATNTKKQLDTIAFIGEVN